MLLGWNGMVMLGRADLRDAGRYRTTPAATRDLADLVARKALVRRGELRYARYGLAIQPRPVKPIYLGPDGGLTAASQT